MEKSEIVVVGAGIAGLTSAAILSKLGLSVTLIEAHKQAGGCAGTFKRRKYIFDVGATQVAGLEEEGIHSRIFNFLDVPKPSATILNPSCSVDLRDGTKPINIWYDQEKWALERELQFPGSDYFWKLTSYIHKSNWIFANNNPIIPFRNVWDFSQFFNALIPSNILSGLLLKMSMYHLLKICGCHKDKRLIRFLNLQLKLYSQEDVYKTAALYGCTVMQISQSPYGLWHLKKSMQSLSDPLEKSLYKTKAKLNFGEKVKEIRFNTQNQYWEINTVTKNSKNKFYAKDVVFTAPPQSLLSQLDDNSVINMQYKKSLENLPKPSGAVVFYSALRSSTLKQFNSNHYQFFHEELGSIFISISQDGDGRAPKGEVTLIASVFTETADWFDLEKSLYVKKKKEIYEKISLALEDQFSFESDQWLHRELATPLGFEKWTSRPRGIVGGLGQRPKNFGLFGLPSRTPLKGLWLCGDSIYPGEGTAGVSQSALMVVRQILYSRGINEFNI